MAYFSNGSEGMSYQEYWCDRCVHGGDCPVWDAHMLHNYRDCNDPESILHMLIPRSESGMANDRCRMFIESSASGDLFGEATA
jgi:hypothetical protein